MAKPVSPTSTSFSTSYTTWVNGYNAGPLNRWKTLVQIAISKRMPSRRHPNSAIIFLSPYILVKYGRTVHLSEASALLFLASSAPNIPVPKLHCAFRDDKNGLTYIVMERIDRQPLSDVFNERWGKEKDELLAQLKGIFRELRGLKKPAGMGIADGAVCAADGGICMIIGYGTAKGMGPFSNEAEYDLFLRNGVANTDNITDPETKADVQNLIEMHRKLEGTKANTVFTHGDVSPSNILVKPGRVVGIVDWEMSGWYPEYWEYTTAINAHYLKGWTEEISEFLGEWPREKEMDDLWRRLWCDGP